MVEYERRKVHGNVSVISVKKHKTSVTGPARLSLSQEDDSRLSLYVSNIRAQVDPTGVYEPLLLLPGPTIVKKIQPLLGHLETKFKVKVPTSTTQVAAAGSSKDIRMIAKAMSHRVDTHRKSYEMLGTSENAAEAHRIIGETSKVQKEKAVQQRVPYDDEEEEEIKGSLFPEVRHPVFQCVVLFSPIPVIKTIGLIKTYKIT